MKKILSIMILLAGVISFTSCSNDDPTYTAPAQLALKSADAFFEAAGGTGSIVVNSAEAIQATSTVDWVSATVSGNTVTLTVAPNENLEGRSANIVLKSATAAKEVNITQRGIIYGLAKGNVFRISDTADSKVNVPVTQSANVNASSLVDWLTASFNSQTSMIEVVAASNDVEKERVGYVAIQTGTVKDTLMIIQDPFVFDVDTKTIEVASQGGVQAVAVKHSRSVTAEADVDWIACELNAKADSIIVTVAENTGEDRQGTITVKSLEYAKTISVTQKAPEQGTEPQEEENPLYGTYSFYFAYGENTYDMGSFTIGEYTGEDAEEGDVLITGLYVPESEVIGFIDGDKLYIYANQPMGLLNDAEYGDYGNFLMSASNQQLIVFDITPDGIISNDLCIMATDPGYTEGWWWEIPTGGTSIFVKAAAARMHRAAAKSGFKAKSRNNLPTSFKLFKK